MIAETENTELRHDLYKELPYQVSLSPFASLHIAQKGGDLFEIKLKTPRYPFKGKLGASEIEISSDERRIWRPWRPETIKVFLSWVSDVWPEEIPFSVPMSTELTHNDYTLLGRGFLSHREYRNFVMGRALENLDAGKILDVGGVNPFDSSGRLQCNAKLIWPYHITQNITRRGFLRTPLDTLSKWARANTVTSIAVLEHIPQDQREAFIKNMATISCRYVVLFFPFGSPNNLTAENEIRRIIERAGERKKSLIEHQKIGLPQIDKVKKILRAAGINILTTTFHMSRDLDVESYQRQANTKDPLKRLEIVRNIETKMLNADQALASDEAKYVLIIGSLS